MWRIGGGYVPTWTSAGKAAANSDASAAIRRTTSASSRNAVFRQVCQPRKKLGWQTCLNRIDVRLFFWAKPSDSQERQANFTGETLHFRQVCHPRKKRTGPILIAGACPSVFLSPIPE